MKFANFKAGSKLRGCGKKYVTYNELSTLGLDDYYVRQAFDILEKNHRFEDEPKAWFKLRGDLAGIESLKGELTLYAQASRREPIAGIYYMVARTRYRALAKKVAQKRRIRLTEWTRSESVDEVSGVALVAIARTERDVDALRSTSHWMTEHEIESRGLWIQFWDGDFEGGSR